MYAYEVSCRVRARESP